MTFKPPFLRFSRIMDKVHSQHFIIAHSPLKTQFPNSIGSFGLGVAEKQNLYGTFLQASISKFRYLPVSFFRIELSSRNYTQIQKHQYSRIAHN